MIKLDQEGQGSWAQAAIGAGFKSILFTDIRKSEDIEECHAIIRADTPTDSGRMGVKIRRPALSNYAPDQYLDDLKSLVFCVMIEKKGGRIKLGTYYGASKDQGCRYSAVGSCGLKCFDGRSEVIS